MLVSDAINVAYRDANLTTAGQVPTSTEQAEAVQLLNNFWTALLGNEVGEDYTDWFVPPPANVVTPPANLIGPLTDDSLIGVGAGGTWYLQPIQNSRVLMTITAPLTLYMPQFPDPGARIAFKDIASSAVNINVSGNGHLIQGQTAITAVNPSALSGKEYIFFDHVSSWQQFVPITLADTAFPLAPAFDDLFITWLALRLMPRNAQAADTVLITLYRDLLKKCRQKYRNFQSTSVADPRVSQGQHSYHSSFSGW